MSLYYELFNQSGRPLAIENCHQGLNFTDGGNPDQMGPGWCPYNWFRTSGDVVNLWDRVISNLMTVTLTLTLALTRTRTRTLTLTVTVTLTLTLNPNPNPNAAPR